MCVTGVCIPIIQVLDITDMQNTPPVRNAAHDPVFVHTASFICNLNYILLTPSSWLFVAQAKLFCQDMIDLNVALVQDQRLSEPQILISFWLFRKMAGMGISEKYTSV